MKKIRMGVIGCADIAQRMVIPAIKNSDCLELAAVASRDSLKAQAFARRFDCEAAAGYDALLERDDIQALYVPLPTGLHFEWIKKALKNGKHVFAEKSMATTSAEVAELVSCAQSNRLVLFENFMFTYHSQLGFVRKKLEEGAIGELRALHCSFGFPPFQSEKNIRYSQALGGGALLDAGAYTVKATLLFLGSQVKVAGAYLARHEKHGVDWVGGAILVNQKGVLSHLSFGFDNYYQNTLAFWGSRGKLTMERAFTAPPGFAPKIIIERQNCREEHLLPPDNHFAGILKDFARSIHDGAHASQYTDILDQSKLLTEVRDYGTRKEQQNLRDHALTCTPG